MVSFQSHILPGADSCPGVPVYLRLHHRYEPGQLDLLSMEDGDCRPVPRTLWDAAQGRRPWRLELALSASHTRIQLQRQDRSLSQTSFPFALPTSASWGHPSQALGNTPGVSAEGLCPRCSLCLALFFQISMPRTPSTHPSRTNFPMASTFTPHLNHGCSPS